MRRSDEAVAAAKDSDDVVEVQQVGEDGDGVAGCDPRDAEACPVLEKASTYVANPQVRKTRRAGQQPVSATVNKSL